MYFSRLKLKNWRNFRTVDLNMGERLFVVGPNACGKSNLLDAFRFLRDIAKDGGGLQQATKDRGGLTKIRCLAARQNPHVEIEVDLKQAANDETPRWRYSIGLRQEPKGSHRLLLSHEKVWEGGKLILDRPDEHDKDDDHRLTQTHLEQISSNKPFRAISDVFQRILYLHLVPQLLKYPSIANRDNNSDDPFGLNFLERVKRTPDRIRKSRLKSIESALRAAVPELEELTHSVDERGMSHLNAKYRHWRPRGGWQREDQFSDGTLRVIGLLWSLLESDSLLLLEEPELSLHAAIVNKLPGLMWRIQRARQRQTIITTHSSELLNDRGIRLDEVALLLPRGGEGTVVSLASSKQDACLLLDKGMPLGEILSPMTAPSDVVQLEFFKA